MVARDWFYFVCFVLFCLCCVSRAGFVSQTLFNECWGELLDQSNCPVRPWSFEGPGLALWIAVFQVWYRVAGTLVQNNTWYLNWNVRLTRFRTFMNFVLWNRTQRRTLHYPGMVQIHWYSVGRGRGEQFYRTTPGPRSKGYRTNEAPRGFMYTQGCSTCAERTLRFQCVFLYQSIFVIL